MSAYDPKCDDGVVTITDNGNAIVTEVTDKILRIFTRIADCIRAERQP